MAAPCTDHLFLTGQRGVGKSTLLRCLLEGKRPGGFQAAVLAALDGEKPVCGVLQQADSAFLRRVAAHPRVRVVTVTEENRDTLRHQLCIEK